MDSITEQLSQLQELTDEQISELENSVLSEFENTESQDLTPQSVDALEQLANAVEAVRTEKSRRVAAAEALAAKAAEATARVRGAEQEQEATPAEGSDPGAEAETAFKPKDPNAPQDPNAMPPAHPPAAAPPAAPGMPPKPAVHAPPPAAPAPGAPPVNPAAAPLPGDVPPAPGTPEYDAWLKKKQGYSNDETATAEQPSMELSTQEPAAAAAAPAPEPTSTPEPAPTVASAPAEEPAPAPEPDPAPAPEPDTAPATESEPPAAPTEAAAAVAEEQVASTETPVEAEASTAAEAPAETTSENNTNNPEASVTAAAQQGTGGSTVVEPPADRRPLPKPTATLSITAGADIPGISAGTRFDTMLDVADAFTRRLHSLRHVNGGDGEQHIVASLQSEFPEDRLLGLNDTSENTEKIQRVTSPDAITAAAGICLPLETRYDLGCDVGVTDRPIRDALARFGADRGGIRFFNAPVLADTAAATGFWRGDANGQNWATYGPDRTTPTNPTNQKPCLEVQCTSEVVAYIEAITLCLTFNNLTVRTFPELVKRHNELALVAHARVAENALLARLEAGSTAITAQSQVVGATREILNLLGRAVAQYRFKNRMNNLSPLRMLAPMWMMELMRSDIALQMPGDGLNDVLGLAESQINAWFRARNVNITWHLDGVGPATADLDGGGAGTAIGFTWPTTIEFGLWAEGTWLYLDGGTLDLGVIRDSSLVATNQYKEFVETFEGLAKVGCDSYWVTAAYAPSGQAAALVDTLP